jgi:DNA-binding CsgD family transcriptional regulator
MPVPEVDILAWFVANHVEWAQLTPSERDELFHIARGFSIKGSANADHLSPDTIRVRRKQIYSKLRVSGANHLNSNLLAVALAMLANGERIESKPGTPA